MSDADKKTVVVKVRTTRDERENWKSRAHQAGVPLSDLIRKAIGRVRTWTLEDKTAHRERTRELARIGNNLNQIARWCNQYKSNAESIPVVTALVEIEQALKDLDRC